MRYAQWTGMRRARRLLAILLAALTYLLLLAIDGLRFFPYETSHHTPLLLAWISFGFSGFVGLLFLAVGALVWLYARDRLVALLLFCFSFTMVVTFATEAGAISSDLLLSTISGVSSALAILLFAALLLLFPKNYLLLAPAWEGQRWPKRQYYYSLLPRWYLAVLTLLSLTEILYSIFYYLRLTQLEALVNPIAESYYLVALVGILITIIVSYRQSSTLRKRQQLRIFVSGVIFAFAPLLILTILPAILNPSWGVPGQFSALTFALLPLALGYSILRYQILIFDS